MDRLGDWTVYIRKMTRYVIESFGPRLAGSPGETATQRFVASELSHWTDSVARLESFRVATDAFMSVPLVSSVLLAAAILSFWISPWLATAFAILSATVLLVEFYLYWPMLDRLYPQRTSHNVAAVLRPSGPVRQRMVINAHADAAREWRLLYRYPRAFPCLFWYLMSGLVVVLLSDFAVLQIAILSPPWRSTALLAVGLLQLAFVPSALLGLFYTSWRHVSPGANDDLSGLFVAVGLARHLRLANLTLEQTELVFLITGAEEAGTRGAKAYARRHHKEWQDMPTALITLETLRSLEHLHVYSHDRNGMIRHDAEVCRLLDDAGRRCGLNLGYAKIFLGSSDAAVFTEFGIRSAVLAGMDPRPADFYHNRRDHHENMDDECLRASCAVLLEAVRQYDAAGLTVAEEAPVATVATW